jgi:DNA-binding NarL/FixJ family response regulator
MPDQGGVESVASRRLKVLVVDDHLLLAETVVAALEDFEVEAVQDVDKALARIAETGRYDVIMLDYALPGMKGLNGLRQLLDANTDGVALFSGVARWPIITRALELGAKGFIPKTLPLRTVENAIRLIADGDAYLPLEYLRQAARGDDNDALLKPREKQVLSFLCEGQQNKEIARELGISEVIVKMDVKSLCRKLGVRNRTEAALLARRDGLC